MTPGRSAAREPREREKRHDRGKAAPAFATVYGAAASAQVGHGIGPPPGVVRAPGVRLIACSVARPIPAPGASFVPARSGSPSRPRAICAPRPLSCNSLPRRTLWRFGGRLGDRRRWRNTTAGLSHLSPRSDQRIRRAEAGMLGRRVSRWGSFGRPDRTDVALGKRSAGFRHHPSAGPAPRADSHRNPLRYALEERRRQGPAKITAWPRQDHGQGRRRQHAGRHEGPPAGAG